jgi:hypothetical protein
MANSPYLPFGSVRIDLLAVRTLRPISPPNEGTIKASMGKVFLQFSTNPDVQRRIREAQSLRARYVRAIFARLFVRCVALFKLARSQGAVEREPVGPRASAIGGG